MADTPRPGHCGGRGGQPGLRATLFGRTCRDGTASPERLQPRRPPRPSRAAPPGRKGGGRRVARRAGVAPSPGLVRGSRCRVPPPVQHRTRVGAPGRQLRTGGCGAADGRKARPAAAGEEAGAGQGEPGLPRGEPRRRRRVFPASPPPRRKGRGRLALAGGGRVSSVLALPARGRSSGPARPARPDSGLCCCCCWSHMEDTPAKAPSPAGLTSMVGASQVLGLAVITLTGVWMGQYRDGIAWESLTLQLNVHPLCMVVGMVFLQGDALLVYRIFRNESKPFTKLLHGLLHALALVISLVGLIAVFKYHEKNGYVDMYSLHSWCGMLAFGGYFIQWLLGLCFFLFPGASLSLRSKYRPQHIFFGIFLLLLSIATGLLGILELLLFKIRDKYSSFAPEGVLANVLGLLLIAFGGVMGYILTRDEWRRPPLAEELALSMDFKKLTEEESPASPN